MKIEELKTNIKRFFSNPNTLTFLLVIVLIVVVYFVYLYMIERAVNPVNIPYATKLIKEKTEITTDLISNVKISGNFVTASGEGLVQNMNVVLGKYVAEGYQVPQNGFFYNSALTDESESQETMFAGIPDNYAVYALDVDFHSTYGCSIMAGNYIDLYFKAIDQQDGKAKVIFDLFIKSIKVAKVVDENGNDVFTYTDDDDEMEPTRMYFIVPTEYFELLRKAELIRNYNIEIIPVPRNAGYSENPEETEIANTAIEDFILAQTVFITN